MYLINYCEHLGERKSNYACLPASPLGCINYHVFSRFDFVNKKNQQKPDRVNVPLEIQDNNGIASRALKNLSE